MLRPLPSLKGYLDVFFDDLIVGGLGHLLDVFQRDFEVADGGETEAGFGDIDRAYLSGERINIAKEIAMNRR